jgi:hypothetical protein
VEVLDTELWGTEFEAPLGMNFRRTLPAFELSGLYFMAKESNTIVTTQNGTIIALGQGEGRMVKVNQGDRIRSTKPIQVDFVTADESSLFAQRWYSLRPTNAITNSYISPVGDTRGKTKLVLYNPDSKNSLVYTVQTLSNGTISKYSNTLLPKQSALSRVIPSGSGAIVDSPSNFVALSFTDTEKLDGNNDQTNGWIFDWGFPLVPRDELTSQVLIGWGYACKNNNCLGTLFAKDLLCLFIHRLHALTRR